MFYSYGLLEEVASTPANGTLSKTQAAQTLAAAATVKISATLAATQSANTISSAGGPIVAGPLSETQAAQTVSAAATFGSGAALSVTQAAQAISGGGQVTVGGTLSATQAAQAISAATATTISGTLAVTQAPNTVIATGTVPIISGALTVTQAAQTLVASSPRADWVPSTNGTQVATIGTEHILATDTTPGTYDFQVRCNNMLVGDVLELRLYTMTLAGGALEVTWKTTVGPSIPGNIVVPLPPQPSDQSLKVTLTQVAGTGRSYDWKLLRT